MRTCVSCRSCPCNLRRLVDIGTAGRELTCPACLGNVDHVEDDDLADGLRVVPELSAIAEELYSFVIRVVNVCTDFDWHMGGR